MPEPFSEWASDHPVYKYGTKPVGSSICFIHPNIITLIGLGITVPVVLNIVGNQSRIALVLLMLVRSLLDCLDGSTARACNKVTRFGAFLDVFCDTTYVTAITITVFYVMFKQGLFGMAQWITVIVMVFISLGAMNETYVEATKIDNRFNMTYARLIHDNTVLLSVIGAILLNMFFKRPLGKAI